MFINALHKLRQLTRSTYYSFPLPIRYKRSLLRNTLGLRGIFSLPQTNNYPKPPNSQQKRSEVLSKLSFPYFEQPSISVIIPCYEQFSYTLHCLASLKAHQPSASYEVIVIDDASPSTDHEALASISGIQLVNNRLNQGFIKSCNHGATIARGEYLYFLNNDTLLLAGTIDELLNTFAYFPNTGIAGSRLIYPDGRLQEAGGIVWNDGSAANVGRFEPYMKPAYSYLREVDYCSGASLMIRRSLFISEGGFDPCYCPAYYEDTDLAMRLRSKGYSIHYQPLSTLVHYEGISNGRHVNMGIKQYQESNKITFKESWKKQLSQHFQWGHSIEQAMNRRLPRRVLLIDTTTPHPDRDAGSICVINLMILLRSMGYQPSFFSDNCNLRETPYTQLCEGLGIEMLSAPFNRSLKQHLVQCGQRYDIVILFRPDICKERLPLIRRLCLKAKVIYYPHDLHYCRFEREAEIKQQSSLFKRAAMYKEIELRNSSDCDATVVVSQKEQQELSGLLPNAKIFLLPLIIQCATTKPYVPNDKGKELLNIVFIGNFQHSPNEDAVLSFASNCLPLIIRSKPSVVLHIVGANLTQNLQAVASANICLHGYIADLDKFLSNMQVSVVPLRYGAGVKGKIASAMRAGVPVVSTSIGIEGIPVNNGENVIIADSDESMADSILALLEDTTRRNQLGEAGRQFADQQWGEQASLEALAKILCALGFKPSEQQAARPLPLFPFTQSHWPGKAL